MAHARQRFTRTVRQPTDWSRLISPVYVAVPAASKILLATTVSVPAGTGFTVRRARGSLSVISDQSAVIENQMGSMGFMVVSDIAVVAGAASIPGPSTQASDDAWFVWVPFNQATAQNIGGGAGMGPAYPFDSKAMRKVEGGFSVAIMVENFHATHGLLVAIGFSILASKS